MTLISLLDASKEYGAGPLFKNINLHINEKDKLGLIGRNGSGKSTLLKVIARIEELDTGKIDSAYRHRISFVSQESILNNRNTILEEVLSNCLEKKELLIEFNQTSSLLEKEPLNKYLLKKLGQISERMDAEKAWDIEQDCKEILQRLGINNLDTPTKNLSGGYKKRVAVASALVAKPDLLLLDEPTNHLDATSVEWLESWLRKFNGAVILVTHDRYFLDKVTNKIIELEEASAYTYTGNYSSFLEQKAIKLESNKTSESKFKNMLRKELKWLSQGAKARSSKQKARVKRIEEMKKNQSNPIKNNLLISSNSSRLGKMVIEVENLWIKANGEKDINPIVKDFSYQFSPEDRVGIIGANGIGKSTLLDVLSGRKECESGNIKIGETVKIGYLEQGCDALREKKFSDKKVINFIEEVATRIKLNKKEFTASQLLEKFLFTPAQQNTTLKKLSGGELRRLTLCRILIQSPNVLLLDEPTNDLDIDTLIILEEFLENFKGCVIIVSHDRYFLNKTVDRIFNFEKEGSLKQYEGNYSDFIKSFKSDALSNKGKVKKTAKLIIKDNYSNEEKKKISFAEKKELEKLNQQIPLLEKQKSDLEISLSESNQNLVRKSQELADLIETLRLAENRWLDLSELI